MIDPTFIRDAGAAPRFKDFRGPGFAEQLMLWFPNSKSTYSTQKLGKSSQAFIDRFGNWPQKEMGWRGTLTNAPAPQSTFGPSQKFSREVFQTRETRMASGTQPFQILRQHQSTPNLNPNLAYMFKEKNTQIGAVRRTTRRFL